MPRPSGNPDTATGGGSSRFKPGAGRYKVIKAAYGIDKSFDYQGTTITSPVGLQLACVECDANWNALPLKKEGEHFLFFFKMGDKSLAKGVHPGQGTSIDDADPQDLGAQPETWGNTIFIPENELGNASLIPKNTGYMIAMKTLQAAGFDAKIIANMWAPGFEGLEFELQELRSADALNAFMKWEGRDKTNLDGPFKVIKEIRKGTGGNVQAVNGAPALSIDEMAAGVLKQIAADYAGRRVAAVAGTAAATQGKLHYPMASLGAVQKRLLDKDFVLSQVPGIQLEDGGAMTFPA